MDYLFEIERMKCAYRDAPERTVLEIDKLQIEQGKIVFFVGPSGIGKSTILETLGIMNNTIQSVDKFEYNGKDLSKVWTWFDEDVSQFRNDEFSFIFQQNNLMPNFSAYENVMSSALIRGMGMQDASRRTKHVLEQVDVPSEEDRPVYKYSGGQQQRLAFARAILPKFHVLFGDEPTGNLDPGTARVLFNVLADQIRERNAAAIIVSHDIGLAVDYADMIVRIVPEKDADLGQDKMHGRIDSRSLYFRHGEKWLYEDKSYSSVQLKDMLMKELYLNIDNEKL